MSTSYGKRGVSHERRPVSGTSASRVENSPQPASNTLTTTAIHKVPKHLRIIYRTQKYVTTNTGSKIGIEYL